MRKASKIVAFIFTFFLFTQITTSQSFTYIEYWEVSSMHTKVDVNIDGSMNINENILADFSNEAHRGLARSIPTNDRRIEFISATNEKGEPWSIIDYDQYDSYIIEMKTQDNSEMNDKALFNIKYNLYGSINYFQKEISEKLNTYPHDEIYLNINGTDWPVKFNSLTTEINFPFNLEENLLEATCYSGYYKETENNCQYLIKDNSIIFKTNDVLNEYENLSIVVAIKPGLIKRPISEKKLNIDIDKNGIANLKETINGNFSDFQYYLLSKTFEISRYLEEESKLQNLRLKYKDAKGDNNYDSYNYYNV